MPAGLPAVFFFWSTKHQKQNKMDSIVSLVVFPPFCFVSAAHSRAELLDVIPPLVVNENAGGNQTQQNFARSLSSLFRCFARAGASWSEPAPPPSHNQRRRIQIPNPKQNKNRKEHSRKSPARRSLPTEKQNRERVSGTAEPTERKTSMVFVALEWCRTFFMWWQRNLNVRDPARASQRRR